MAHFEDEGQVLVNRDTPGKAKINSIVKMVVKGRQNG
jgi:hypothetical protein